MSKLENITPSKSVKLTPALVAEAKAPEAAVLPQTAISMVCIPQQGEIGAKYVLVEIPFNFATGEVGAVKEIYRDIREDTIDRFKVKVDELSFFTGV